MTFFGIVERFVLWWYASGVIKDLRNQLKISHRLLIAVAVGATLTLVPGASVSAGKNTFWFSSLGSITSNPKLHSLNVSTGILTTMREFPKQNTLSGSTIPVPVKKLMTYYDSVNSRSGIYFSQTLGNNQELLVEGTLCTGESCPSTRLRNGSFSWDASLYTYKNNNINYLMDMKTKTSKKLNLKTLYPPDFSPKKTYIYGSGPSTSAGVQWQRVKGKKVRTVKLPVVSWGREYFSPDEQYIAAAGFDVDGNGGRTTTVMLVDVNKKKLVDIMKLPGSLVASEIVWLTNRSFLLVTDPDGDILKGNSVVRFVIAKGDLSFTTVYKDSPGTISNVQKINATTLLINQIENPGSIDKFFEVSKLTTSGILTPILEKHEVAEFNILGRNFY